MNVAKTLAVLITTSLFIPVWAGCDLFCPGCLRKKYFS
jgi:hypothetical protein